MAKKKSEKPLSKVDKELNDYSKATLTDSVIITTYNNDGMHPTYDGEATNFVESRVLEPLPEDVESRDMSYTSNSLLDDETYTIGDRYVITRMVAAKSALIAVGTVYEVSKLLSEDRRNCELVKIRGDGPESFKLGRDRSMVNKLS